MNQSQPTFYKFIEQPLQSWTRINPTIMDSFANHYKLRNIHNLFHHHDE